MQLKLLDMEQMDIKHPHVVCGDLAEAVGQLGHQLLVLTGQEMKDIFCYPSAVQEPPSFSGRKWRGQGKVVPH